MATRASWKRHIDEYGSRTAFTAANLFTAEQRAYAMFDATVREMTFAGHGVLSHSGNNMKAIITSTIALLAFGDDKRFREELKRFSTEARRDALHYAPIYFGLNAAAIFLQNVRPRRSLDNAAKRIFALLTEP